MTPPVLRLSWRFLSISDTFKGNVDTFYCC